MSYRNVPRRLGAFLAAAMLVGCASAAEPAGDTAGAAPPAPEARSAEEVALIAQGMQLFQGGGRCFVCHGNFGSGGDFGPNLTDDNWVWIDPGSDSAVQDIVSLIRTGTPEPRITTSGMPPAAGNMSEAQLTAIANYVLSL